MKTAFIDVDTQLDFLLPSGALYVPGAERIIPALSSLNLFAASRDIPLISTVDAHEEDDPEFHTWPPHCISGTIGQQKPRGTLLEHRTIVAAGSVATWPSPQIILEKQTTEFFSDLAPLLDSVRADRWVVYGVVAEICVRCVVMNLAQRGERVELVIDAVQGLSDAARDQTFADLQSAGGKLITVAEAISPA